MVHYSLHCLWISGNLLNDFHLLGQQEQKLQDEIDKLNAELLERDAFIERRKMDIATLQSHITESSHGFNAFRAQRDKLQDERKYVLICPFIESLQLFTSEKRNYLLNFPVFSQCFDQCIGRCGARKVNLLLKLIG